MLLIIRTSNTCRIARPRSRRDAVSKREWRCSSVAALLWNANLVTIVNVTTNLAITVNLDARHVMSAPRPEIATIPRSRGRMHRRPRVLETWRQAIKIISFC